MTTTILSCTPESRIGQARARVAQLRGHLDELRARRVELSARRERAAAIVAGLAADSPDDDFTRAAGAKLQIATLDAAIGEVSREQQPLAALLKEAEQTAGALEASARQTLADWPALVLHGGDGAQQARNRITDLTGLSAADLLEVMR